MFDHMNFQDLCTVPSLTTAFQGPLSSLETRLLAKQSLIEEWFCQQWQHTPAPFYASVDLRHAGFKLAPVDTNLFPAGFNNLNPVFFPLCIQALDAATQSLKNSNRRILLIPENHTRNSHYLEHLVILRDLLQQAHFEVRIGTLLPEIDDNLSLTLPSGRNLLLEPLIRTADSLGVKGFIPSLILLNNDLSMGIPSILENLPHQLILPPLHMGWRSRLKSTHFTHYRQVAQEFSEFLNIDSWLIDPLFKNCGEINFMTYQGQTCLADNVSALLQTIKRKYLDYHISFKPFVVIKADAGSYGMGVMSVHSADEIHSLNRKQRSRMSASKDGLKIRQVILQEGIYSLETWNQHVAEPVIYMIDHFVVGGFYRVHKTRNFNENLNAPGMHFVPLDFAHAPPETSPNRFYAYGVIAQLAQLAAAREITLYSKDFTPPL